MLLLMMESKLEQFWTALRKPGHGLKDRLVHPRAIIQHLPQRRTGQQPAQGAGVAQPFRFIVAVEKKGPGLAVVFISGDMIPQQECFEEPATMRKVPFGRRRIRHGLGRGISVRKRLGE